MRGGTVSWQVRVTAEFKQRVAADAERAGMGVGEWLMHAYEQYKEQYTEQYSSTPNSTDNSTNSSTAVQPAVQGTVHEASGDAAAGIQARWKRLFPNSMLSDAEVNKAMGMADEATVMEAIDITNKYVKNRHGGGVVAYFFTVLKSRVTKRAQQPSQPTGGYKSETRPSGPGSEEPTEADFKRWDAVRKYVETHNPWPLDDGED